MIRPHDCLSLPIFGWPSFNTQLLCIDLGKLMMYESRILVTDIVIGHEWSLLSQRETRTSIGKNSNMISNYDIYQRKTIWKKFQRLHYPLQKIIPVPWHFLFYIVSGNSVVCSKRYFPYIYLFYFSSTSRRELHNISKECRRLTLPVEIMAVF